MAYGYGTRSWMHSTEFRQMKKSRTEATTEYLSSDRQEVVVGPMCTCRSFQFPHEIKAHKKLRSGRDWRHWSKI